MYNHTYSQVKTNVKMFLIQAVLNNVMFKLHVKYSLIREYISYMFPCFGTSECIKKETTKGSNNLNNSLIFGVKRDK